MSDTDREQLQELLRSPEWREWFIDQALSDSPPAWIGQLKPVFRAWFVNRLHQEVAQSLLVTGGVAALARQETVNRLAERWGVTGLHPDVEHAGYELLAALAEHSRIDDDTAETADPSDPATLVLWLAEVRCERCGFPLAKAAARTFDFVFEDDHSKMHVDPTSIEYMPDPRREGGLLVWRCYRCPGDRHVSERRAFRIIKSRWLKRSRSLGASARPVAHTVILAGVSEGQ